MPCTLRGALPDGGSLRLIAAITQAEVIRKMLRHLKLTADPPPIAPARARQATFAWVASAHAMARGLRGDVRATAVCLLRERHLGACAISFEIPPSGRPSRGLRP